MFGKHTLFLFLLIVVLVGPAVYFNSDWTNFLSVKDAGFANNNVTGIPARTTSTFDLSPGGLSQPVSTVQVAAASYGNSVNPARVGYNNSPPPAPLPNDVILPGTTAGPDFNAVPLEFMPVSNLGEIFRFDANPTWVRNRWTRISTATGSNGLTGLRVPLVTGVNANDLFGSLTYYFDRNQVTQKITFRGWTGNPDTLVEYLTKNFGLKNQPTTAAGLYVAKTWRKASAALYMQHPTVIRKDNPTQQVAVLLEINNPKGPFELSPEVASMIFNSPR